MMRVRNTPSMQSRRTRVAEGRGHKRPTGNNSTYNIFFNDEKGKVRGRQVKPRGAGWELHDARELNYTTWRRRRTNRNEQQ